MHYVMMPPHHPRLSPVSHDGQCDYWDESDTKVEDHMQSVYSTYIIYYERKMRVEHLSIFENS